MVDGACATSPRAVGDSGGCNIPFGRFDRRPDKLVLERRLDQQALDGQKVRGWSSRQTSELELWSSERGLQGFFLWSIYRPGRRILS